MVGVLAFYSVDPSSNAAEVYSFNSVNCLNEKIYTKEAGVGPFLKAQCMGSCLMLSHFLSSCYLGSKPRYPYS